MRGKRVSLNNLKTLAKRLRRDQTDAEHKLWMQLRTRELHGFKFRRQHPIDRYIVDFCCIERRLIVELDGGQHLEQAEADRRRTDALVRLGYRVIRFWDHEVLTSMETVLEQIAQALKHPPS